MCLQFLSLSSGAKLQFNHEFSFCLMEISPVSNPINKEENQEECNTGINDFDFESFRREFLQFAVEVFRLENRKFKF